MRTVLVCVRTPLAAQTVASTAARLGMTGVVRTAVSETEAMIRLAERPAEVVLADTAVTRPDSVGFTRRVLARHGGTFELSVRDPRQPAGRGWALGLGRYRDDHLEWFRIFSPLPRPRRTWGRNDLTLESQRETDEEEGYALYSGQVRVRPCW